VISDQNIPGSRRGLNSGSLFPWMHTSRCCIVFLSVCTGGSESSTTGGVDGFEACPDPPEKGGLKPGAIIGWKGPIPGSMTEIEDSCR
jgi:hypothetical protein